MVDCVAVKYDQLQCARQLKYTLDLALYFNYTPAHHTKHIGLVVEESFWTSTKYGKFEKQWSSNEVRKFQLKLSSPDHFKSVVNYAQD